AHRNRLRKLAQYIDQTWPDDTAADDARYQLGVLLLDEKKYAEAVEALARISPGYSESIRAQFQLAMAAMQAQKDGVPPPPGKPSYDERAVTALKSIPELTPGADAGTAQMFFLARLELSRTLYGEKKYAEMHALLDKLSKALENADAKLLDDKV